MPDEEIPKRHQQLAPPSTDISKVKSPLSLYMETAIIFWMFFVTIFFKMFRSIKQKSKKSVRGKVVMITGTGRGLGREMAIQFAKLGAKLACVDVDQKNNMETVRLIEYHVSGTMVKAYTVNVAATNEINALAVKVEAELGPVDVLINNAAVIVGHNFLDGTNQTITAMINVNLLSHFWMVRTFLPSMIKRNSGHIVAISSITALSGVPKLSTYSACTSGIKGMMESLREELRENPLNKIQTTVVLPKIINTSADYMKFVNSRSPVLTVEEAAKETVDGILTDEIQFTIPSNINLISSIMRILPTNTADSIKKAFYVKLTLPSEGIGPIQNMELINNNY